jgi:stalled ribosome rescue protein Dom34
MMNAVLWIDQKEARIFELDEQNVASAIVNPPGRHIHRHPKALELRTRNHPEDEHRYFHDVAQSLAGCAQILLVGPAQTKLHFFRYLHDHDRQLAAKIVGVESSDHPSDGQLIAHLRTYFDERSARVS